MGINEGRLPADEEVVTSGKKIANPAVMVALAGALTAATPAIAEDKTGQATLAAATTETSQQITAATHCPTYAREGNTRAEKKARLVECRTHKQQLEIAALDNRIAELQSYITEQGLVLNKLRILNDKGEELARIVEENGRLRLEIGDINAEISGLKASQEATRQRIIATLQRIDAFLASRQG